MRVETTTGIVVGERKHGIAMWRGIPYAEPPGGEADVGTVRSVSLVRVLISLKTASVSSDR